MPYAHFARKPVSLETLKEDIAQIKRFAKGKGDYYFVAEEKELSNQEWQDFTNYLLEDHDWIQSFSDKEHVNDGAIPCIRVTAPGSEIALIIDPAGYGYARYAAIEPTSSEIKVEKERTWFCTESKQVLTEFQLREEYESQPDKDLMTFEEYIKMGEEYTLRRFSVAADCDRDEDDCSFEIEDQGEPAEGLDESTVQEAIWGMLAGEWDVDNSLLRGCYARTYSEAGTLTNNKGLVITMPDGSEFQITIVKSR